MIDPCPLCPAAPEAVQAFEVPALTRTDAVQLPLSARQLDPSRHQRTTASAGRGSQQTGRPKVTGDAVKGTWR